MASEPFGFPADRRLTRQIQSCCLIRPLALPTSPRRNDSMARCSERLDLGLNSLTSDGLAGCIRALTGRCSLSPVPLTDSPRRQETDR
jgi:hypothetical protein